MPNSLLLLDDLYPAGLSSGFDGIEARKLSDFEIRLLQEKAKLISMFDINETDRIKHLMKMKVNFITTDRIDLCLQAR